MNSNKNSLFEIEESRVCGIDEAGRGPIAGPLVVAGVVLKSSIKGLKDSKKLSQKRREELFEKIKADGIYHIVVIESQRLDALGLSKSINFALKDIKNRFSYLNIEIIFDGNSSFGVTGIRTIVKADEKIPEVSAASILAKVTRDRIMLKYAKEFPNYGFERHKGYCTKKHLDAILKFGLCRVHRRSFKIPINYPEKTLFD